MYRRWPLAALAVALALITAPAAFGASSDPPAAAAGWHGREIRDPLPQRVRGTVARFPRGWSAGSVGPGTGYLSRNGSRRVREVQRRLLRRGYRPGLVDGRYGARTRAAVIWFQTKHGLPRTGRVDARSVATMRQTPRARPTGDAPSPRSAAEKAGALARATPQAVPAQQAGRTWLVLLAGDHGRPRGDRLVAARRAARTPSRARRRRSRRAPRAADGAYAAAGARARRGRRLHRPRARQRPRARDRRPPRRSSGPGARVAAGSSPRSSTTSSLPADASPTDRDWPTRSTRSPPAASRASCSPTWATSHARSPSSPSCCDG